jgi:O-antigen ligase
MACPAISCEKKLMVFTPMLCFEICLAAVLAVGVLWTKPEYGLFLYALALGFPDVALPLGDAINIRVDDVLLLVFLARVILWNPASTSRRQNNIYLWQGIFLGLCLLSIAVESLQGSRPGAYETAKMAGCVAILLVLPRLLQTEKRLRFFVAGLMCGGIALVIQIRMHLGESTPNSIANFQELKGVGTFSTWNPNTIGQAALLLVFGAGLGAILFSKTLANKILWPCLAMGFALVPATLFVRGTTLSIAAGFVAFLLMGRRWKSVLLFAAACLCAVLYVHARNPQLMEDATSVNVATGEGFSHRFDRWGMALQGIQTQPFVGHGFGQELTYLTLIGGEGRAHDAYLAVWLELGLGGLLLFLVTIFQFVRAGFILYGNPRFQLHGTLILALILALALDSLGLPTLYWEKLPTIALSLAVALVGLCERDVPEISSKEVCWPSHVPVATHL